MQRVNRLGSGAKEMLWFQEFICAGPSPGTSSPTFSPTRLPLSLFCPFSLFISLIPFITPFSHILARGLGYVLFHSPNLMHVCLSSWHTVGLVNVHKQRKNNLNLSMTQKAPRKVSQEGNDGPWSLRIHPGLTSCCNKPLVRRVPSGAAR